MARSIRTTTRIADLPWGQMTQFVTRLNNAGLTGDHVKKLLDNPELLTKAIEATKALLAEPIWEHGSYYQPVTTWDTVALGVQMMRPEPPCGEDLNHVLIRVKSGSCFCDSHWGEANQIHLTDTWMDIAPGVQIKKSLDSGVAIRTYRSLKSS